MNVGRAAVPDDSKPQSPDEDVSGDVHPDDDQNSVDGEGVVVRGCEGVVVVDVVVDVVV